MKGMWEFLRRANADEKGVYRKEKDLITESMLYVFYIVVAVFLLATPLGRSILQYLAYIGMGLVLMVSVAFLYANYQTLKISFAHDKKLEKLGTTREKEHERQRMLCEAEGDDGLPPNETV